MKNIIETFKNSGNLHHAYLLEGEKAIIRQKLFEFIEKDLKHPVQGNPDFWHETFQTFSIDDARRLRDMQALKPIVQPRKIFIIEVFSMTIEAQNALLKIFEEPTPGTHFFVIADSADLFLPTLRSRMLVVSDDEYSADRKIIAKKFLESSTKDRLDMVAAIIEEKDKVEASHLIDGLIVELSSKPNEYAEALRELLHMRSFLTDRSPSLKLILEHISLILY
jgi:DNA polymerase III delta prime subunit